MDRGRPASIWSKPAGDDSWVTIRSALSPAEIVRALRSADRVEPRFEVDVDARSIAVAATAPGVQGSRPEAVGRIEADAGETRVLLRRAIATDTALPVRPLIGAGLALVGLVAALAIFGVVPRSWLGILCFVPLLLGLGAVASAVTSEPPVPAGGKAIQWVAGVLAAAEKARDAVPPAPSPRRVPRAPYR